MTCVPKELTGSPQASTAAYRSVRYAAPERIGKRFAPGSSRPGREHEKSDKKRGLFYQLMSIPAPFTDGSGPAAVTAAGPERSGDATGPERFPPADQL